METKNILMTVAAILVLAGIAFGVAYLIRRDGEAANNAATENTTNSNTTERERIIVTDTFLTRLNRDLNRLERKIVIERGELETKIAELVTANAERKTRIGDLKATYPELTEEQQTEIDALTNTVRENRTRIDGYNEQIEVLDAKQTIVEDTRKEKSSMTAGELIDRAVEINGFINELE